MLGYGPIGIFPLGRSPYPAGIYPFAVDTHDGGNRQFIRRKPLGEYDPSAELEIKAKRRQDIQEAIYGGRDELLGKLYGRGRKSRVSEPLEAKKPVIHINSVDLMGLAHIVMASRQAHQQHQDLMMGNAELDAVIREIFQ